MEGSKKEKSIKRDNMKEWRNRGEDEERKLYIYTSPFLTWCPLQHREHLSLGTGEGDARFATALLAQYRRVAEKLAGPFLSTHWCLWLLLRLLLSDSLDLNSNRPAYKTQSMTRYINYWESLSSLMVTADAMLRMYLRRTSVPAPAPPPASTTASIFSSSTMATLSSVFLRFSCSFLMSSRKRFSLVGFSGAVGVTELATWAVEAGSAEVGEVGEPPVQSCSTVMFLRLSRIFRASFNSLKPREAPSLQGFSAPLTAPPGVVPEQNVKLETR